MDECQYNYTISPIPVYGTRNVFSGVIYEGVSEGTQTVLL